MTQNEEDGYLLVGRTCMYPQYRYFAIYYVIRLPLFGSNEHQLMKEHKILVLAFLSTATFMIMTQSEKGGHLLVGRTCMYPQYRPFATYYIFRLPFFGSNADTS